MESIEELAQVGTEIARDAGRFLLEKFHSHFTVSHKGAVNLVTDADIAAENLIVSRIKSAFPSHSILAEEIHNVSQNENSGSPFRWVIDPLDGTTNFAHGYPVFSVSIGVEKAGDLEMGIVYDPTRDEMFTARRGNGSFCNGVKLRVSKTGTLLSSLLATGFPYDIQTSKENNLNNFCAFAERTQGIRRAGSAAVDLCYVAAGRFDGFWELKLNPWDCAAGFLMVREAGGIVTNFHGQPASIYEREVVASNGLIHQEMLDVLEIADSRFEIRRRKQEVRSKNSEEKPTRR
jgi:myo-inositol-1(or 4)-monophosphatase